VKIETLLKSKHWVDHRDSYGLQVTVNSYAMTTLLTGTAEEVCILC